MKALNKFPQIFRKTEILLVFGLFGLTPASPWDDELPMASGWAYET